MSTRWLQPFMRSHAIFFGVLAAEAWSATHRADKVNTRLAEVAYNIRGGAARCGVEASPSKRQALQSVYDRQSLNRDTTFAECKRALVFFNQISLIISGYYTQSRATWIWDITAAATCALT